jgi:hypothetical protein
MKARVAVVVLSVVAGLGMVAPAFADGQSFPNCTVMKMAFPHGVAKSAKAAAKPSPFWIRIKPPLVNAAIYAVNKRLDRDGDGIACEVAK